MGSEMCIRDRPKGTGEKASPEEAAAVAASAAAAAATAKGAQEAAGVAPTAPKAPQETAVRPSTEAKAVEEPATITPATEAKAAAPPPAPAAASEQAKGRSVGGDFVFGLRAGLIVPTQQILENLSSGTSTGPLVNLEGYYVLREWVRLGLMFEWQRYKINGRGACLLYTSPSPRDS